MKKNRRVIVAACLIALLFGVGGYQLQFYLTRGGKNESSGAQVIGTPAKDFMLEDTDGVKRRLSEWQGKVVALNFWATWCPPCREEIPHFVTLQARYLDDGLQFVGITLQQADEVQNFLAEFNVNYPSLVGGFGAIHLAKVMGNNSGALPYTVIIDRNGLITFTKSGVLSVSEAESVIRSLL